MCRYGNMTEIFSRMNREGVEMLNLLEANMAV